MVTLKYNNTVLSFGKGIDEKLYIEKKDYDPFDDMFKNIISIEVKGGGVRIMIDESKYFIDSELIAKKLENLVNQMMDYIEKERLREIPKLIESTTEAIKKDLEEEEKDFGVTFNNTIKALERLAEVLSINIIKA